MQSSEQAPFTPEIVSFNPEIGFMTIMQNEFVNSFDRRGLFRVLCGFLPQRELNMQRGLARNSTLANHSIVVASFESLRVDKIEPCPS